METLGRYTLVRPLAQGGMGDVYLARVTGAAGFTRPAVIKRVRPELRGRGDAVGMFLDEARLSAQLNHPHIVQVYDLGETEGGFYMAMEYVDGVHLGRLMRVALAEGVPLPAEACLYAGARVAEALHYAHHARNLTTGEPLLVVHRDVSPSNILVSAAGDVKLTDFGVAKAKTQQVKTALGYVKGKVAYLSPEQVELGPVDGRSDVFSLGVVLWELLARMRLYKERDEFVAMNRIAKEPPPRPSQYNPTVPPDVDALVLRALAKAPEERYPNAGALQDALDGWLREHNVFHGRQDLAQRISSLRAPLGLDTDAVLETEVLSPRELKERVREAKAAASTPSAAPTTQRGRASRRADTEAPPLPSFDTPFVGRAEALRALVGAFGRGSRILTVVGPEGIGKTRLAVELARRLFDPGADDDEGRVPVSAAYYCDLRGAHDLDAVAERIARGLGVALALGKNAADAVVQLGAALMGRGPALFVLDGVEPLAGTVGETLVALGRAAPDARFLVTSRSPVDGHDDIYELRPLPQTPDRAGEGSDDPVGFDAVDLFVQRVRTVRPDYVLTQDDAATVARIVARLGGNPLAIEVAAGQVTGEDVAELLDRLDGGPEDEDLGEDSVSVAVDFGLKALSVPEQEALVQAAVFPGRISAAAASAVIALSTDEPVEAVLDRLVQRSLLRRERSTSSGVRQDGYRLTDGLRLRAERQLEVWPGRSRLEERFDAYHLNLGEDLASQVDGPLGLQARAALSSHLDEMVAVADRTLRHRPGQTDADLAIRAALVLDAHYATVGPTTQHLAYLDRAAEQLASFEQSDGRLAARLLIARGQACFFRGWAQDAVSNLEEARDLARELDDAALEARALYHLADPLRTMGPSEDVLPLLERALTLARSAQEPGVEGRIQGLLGALRLDVGDVAGAETLLAEAIERLQDTGDRAAEGRFFGQRAQARLLTGDAEGAFAFASKAIELFRLVDDRRSEAEVTGFLGDLYAERGDAGLAEDLYRRGLKLAREVGDQRREALLLAAVGAVQAERGELDGRLDQARFDLDAAETLLAAAGLSALQGVVDVMRGQVLLAEARAAHAAGDSVTAEARLLAVERLVKGPHPAAARSAAARLARSLEAGLG